MDRSELIREIEVSMGIHAEGLTPGTIKKMLESMIEVITRSIRDKEPVRIDNLCIFKPHIKGPRTYNNLNTGKGYEIPEKNWVKVTLSQNLLKRIQP